MSASSGAAGRTGSACCGALPGLVKGMAGQDGPAWQAVKEACGMMLHWSSAISAVAVVVVAHWLAVSGKTSDRAGLVFGASFAVFALLLPAVAILREFVERRQARLS